MSNPSSDRNLLLGAIALQFRLVTREQLRAAFYQWSNEKSQPLDTILFNQKVLTEEQRNRLNEIVELHLQLNSGDVKQSLAALSSVSDLRVELEATKDADLAQSLQYLSQRPGVADDSDLYRTHTFDNFRTQSFDNTAVNAAASVGQLSSQGFRFRILRPHARGGLGEVSVALDRELNREVALKEIQLKHADLGESRSRFMLEAQITGGLEHPGIVPVYGMGTYADGRPFYAMRFIRGDSLKDGIGKFFAKFARAVSNGGASEAVRLPFLPRSAYESLNFRLLLGRFVDVCNAVAYAHARGVLHRDLKPGNIMLGNYGETLVVDWGLAKATGKAEESLDTTQAPLTASTDSASAETMMGSTLGTPAYMSPEQAAGRVDLFCPATDIYCLGATLYHVLTGRPPHIDKSGDKLLEHIKQGNFPTPRTEFRNPTAARVDLHESDGDED